VNRFFTAPELADAYRLPKHVHEQLLAEVAPVEKDDQGEPLFLEAHVDAWLTARYAVKPWRAPSPEKTPGNRRSKAKDAEGQDAFLTVAEAQRRFLSGKMSCRWWYRMATTGQIVHHRVGDKILFQIEDIEKFIAESRRAEEVEDAEVEAPVPLPVPTAPKSSTRKKPGDPVGGFQFFPRKVSPGFSG
jgi:hypothetical protein